MRCTPDFGPKWGGAAQSREEECQSGEGEIRQPSRKSLFPNSAIFSFFSFLYFLESGNTIYMSESLPIFSSIPPAYHNSRLFLTVISRAAFPLIHQRAAAVLFEGSFFRGCAARPSSYHHALVGFLYAPVIPPGESTLPLTPGDRLFSIHQGRRQQINLQGCPLPFPWSWRQPK